jgi:hypothetical protein
LSMSMARGRGRTWEGGMEGVSAPWRGEVIRGAH